MNPEVSSAREECEGLRSEAKRLPKEFTRSLEDAISIALNPGATPDKRARAQYKVGRAAQTTEAKAVGCSDDASHPWLLAASRHGMVEACAALAKSVLAMRGLKVHRPTYSLLPQLVPTANPGAPATTCAIDPLVEHLWVLGVASIRRAAVNNFSGWAPSTFENAIELLTNWLVLPPASADETVRLAQKNQRILEWSTCLILWPTLASGASQAGSDELTSLHRFRKLKEEIWGALVDPQMVSLSPLKQTDKPLRVVDAPESFRVLKARIPPSSDRAEMSLLQTFDQLAGPIETTPLPTLQQLAWAESQLLEEFAWAQPVVHRLISDLRTRARRGARRFGFPPTLLLGRPGCGKTRFAMRFAELLGVQSFVVNMAGMSDAKLLKGQTRGWAGSRPSFVLEMILGSHCASPLFILDELDKASCSNDGNGGRAHDALLDLLEARNAARYRDVFLLAECDLSCCLFIATANSAHTLPAPLLSRMQILEFPGPKARDLPNLALQILRDIEFQWGLPNGALDMPRDTYEVLYRLDRPSVRSVQQAIRIMLQTEETSFAGRDYYH